MATSVYFNNQNATREQFLLEDLTIESIRNHGIDIFYIPRTSQSILDTLFGDDPVKYFDKAYKIDMYLETMNDFEGQQEFFSKFGLNVEKTARVAVARRTFERFVPRSLRNLPKEGDLIYLPVQNKLMEIRFVERERNFFQLGKAQPYMFVLSVETFKYNGEFLNTGMEEIDQVADVSAPSIDIQLTDSNQNTTFARGEVAYQGYDLSTASAKGIVVSFDRPNCVLRLRNIKGTFDGAVGNVQGSIHGAEYILDSYDIMQNATTDYEDNVLLETEADQVLDFTEENPFGEM